MADRVARLAWDARAFTILAAMWVRVGWSYRTSFVVLTVSSLVITGVDFVAIVIMFANVDALGGFGLGQIGFLYGATAVCLGLADLAVGNVERLGRRVRLGTFDAMMVRPVGVFAQMCADEFAFRRVGRIAQGAAVLAWSLSVVDIDWGPARLAMLLSMLVCGAAIFLALFVLGATFQFASGDASEVANAFTYGGNTMTEYPLTIFPTEVGKSLTFVFPIAFTNWYSCLYLLDRTDPFGAPAWFALLPLPVGAVMVALALTVWRAGVRTYTSTGS